jgi:hypothetical protein
MLNSTGQLHQNCSDHNTRSSSSLRRAYNIVFSLIPSIQLNLARTHQLEHAKPRIALA